MSKLQNLENSPLALAPAPGTAALPLKVDVQDISGCTRGSRAQNQGNDCVLAPFHAPVCALRVPVPVPSRSPETHTPPSGVSGPNVLGSNAVERLVPTAGSPGTCCLWADPCSRFPLQDGVAGAWRPADAKGIYDKGMSPAGPLLGIAGIGGDSARAGAAGPEPEFRAPTHGPLTAARFNGLLSVSSRVAMFALPAMPTVLKLCLWVALPVLLAHLLTVVLALLRSSRLFARSLMVLKGLRTRLWTRYCLGNIAASSLLDEIAGKYARTAATGTRGATRSGRNLVSTSTTWSGRLRDRNPPPARSDGSVDHAGAQTAVRNPLHGRNDVVKIIYWNIHHDFTLKLTDEEFQDILKSYDIMFFAETAMLPGEDEAADVPLGYTLVSLPRKPLLTAQRRGGGIALLIRDDIHFVKSTLSSPDILVLDMGSVWLIGAYIPPVSSRWQGWTDVEPIQKLWETVALCTSSQDKGVIGLGDLNARTGNDQINAALQRFPRASADPESKPNTRGRAVLDQCDGYGLVILNGTSLETASPGRCTSWQPGGHSVIDYAIVSENLVSEVQQLHVERPTPDPKDDWSDHTRICLTLDAKVFKTTDPLSDEGTEHPVVDKSDEIDQMYQATMDAKQNPDEALDALWGPILADSPSIYIYVEGVRSHKLSAGAGVFFGPLSPSNMSLAVPGPEPGTADRARIFAIHQVLQRISPTVRLVIFCTSKSVIRQLCYAPAKNMALGWPGPNGDIFKATVKLLAARHARTCFVYVETNADNESRKQAYSLAKNAMRNPGSLDLPPFCAVPPSFAAPNVPELPLGPARKVVTDLSETSPPRPKKWKAGEDIETEYMNQTHRGRAKVHALQAGLRKQLLECTNNKEFWDFVRKRTDPRPKKSKVTVTQLAADFEARLNYPKVSPSSFNADMLKFNARMCEQLTGEAADRSPRQSCTRDITLEDIEWMKRHIKEHGIDTAVGVDGFSYEECLAIPNEKLLEFFLYCLKQRNMPRLWLISLLIGILKQDKDAADPASYRLIALECCMLKMLTLIIDRRIREAAEDLGAIPVTQNGFQAHLRTNDNVFVLICLIDKAYNLNKPLYVAYLDLKNAFPGTDRSTLWVKLATLGISGPMIEWLKILYDRIRYMVRLDGRFAPAFRSLLGILTGDPGSPHLWNLFMSDFILACHPEDIELNGVPITNVEHADDILTASGASAGLQSHLNGSQRWCNNNGCVTSIPKCLCQRFGPGSKLLPTFQLGGHSLSYVRHACYLGVWFEMDSKYIWREQYKVKAKKARTIVNVILGLDRFVGTLPAWDARTLYMARVDPYLTAGCDVVLDVDLKGLKMLEKVQLRFLRRMLGLGARSMRAVLFSETGIWPIRYRRVYLALKALCYRLELDPARPAWNALQDSLTLARTQKSSWINDLRIVLSRLHTPVHFNISLDVTVQLVETAMRDVRLSMEAWIDSEIAASSRVRDLLVGRLEMDNETQKLVKKSLDFRHYLRVKTGDHRRALTRMILSGHSLAIERRRWTERGKKIVPAQWRLCRFCYAYVEDPAHAMFACQHAELVVIRESFLTQVYETLPVLSGTLDPTNVLKFFRNILPRREITPLLAKHAHDVIKIFEATPMLCVSAPTATP